MRVRPASFDDAGDCLGQSGLVVGMDGRDDLYEWDAIPAKGRVQPKALSERLVDREPIGGQVPVPRTDDRSGSQSELNALYVLAGECLAASQPLFCQASLSDVVEEDGDLVFGGVSNGYGAHVELSCESLRVAFEILGDPRLRDTPVRLEPERLEIRSKLRDPASLKVYTGLSLEGRIGLHEAIVDRLVVGIELNLNDGECGLDRVQDCAQTLLRRLEG